MIIDDLLSDLQKKCNNDNIYRGIEVTLNEKGMKIPKGEKNNLSIEKLNETNQNLDYGNCYSLYVKHVPNLYIVDFDTKENLDKCELYNMLKEDNVYHNDSFRLKGYHFYVFIENLPHFKNQQKIGIDKRWEIDLIKINNTWDRKGSQVWGSDYGYYDWNSINKYFNENAMNIVQDKISLDINSKPLPKTKITTETISDSDSDLEFTIDDLPRCSKEQFVGYLDRLNDSRFQYNDWLSVGIVCYNNFDGEDEGYDIWREWSKRDPNYDKTQMSNKEMMLKYETFNDKDNRESKLSYKTLRKWANTDNPLNPFEEAFNNGGDEALIKLMNEYLMFVRDIGTYIILNDNNWYIKKSSEVNEYFEKYTFSVNNNKGNPIQKNIFSIWKKNIKRREVDKIVYDPSNTQENVFNLWKGYKIKYSDVENYEGECQFLLDHILNVWCDGNIDHYNYVLNWLSYKLQYPHKKIGVVICLKSQEGAGKGLVFKLIGKIIGKEHYCSIANINSIIGDFNGMSEGRQLIDLDEAVWGGNKALEGRLKSIITEDEQVVNRKNKEAYVIENYCDYFMTTNEEWFAPVTRNSRRYFCLEMNNKIAGFNLTNTQRDYIKQLMKSDEKAFAKHLYERDVSKFNPRQFVKTKLLQDQVEQNWSSIEGFWFEKLNNQGIGDELWMNKNELCTLDDETPYYCKNWVFEKYKEWDGGSYSRKVGMSKFWKETKDIFKIEVDNRLSSGNRTRYVVFPDIVECRIMFNTYQRYEYTYPPLQVEDCDENC